MSLRNQTQADARPTVFGDLSECASFYPFFPAEDFLPSGLPAACPVYASKGRQKVLAACAKKSSIRSAKS